MTPHALVLGESLVDVVVAGGRTTEHAGGSAANVAVALARLGRPTRFATSFSDDPHGRLVAEHLRGSGVELVGDPHVVRRTSTATATLDATGAATYAFDVDWRLAPVLVGDPVVVHTCSYSALLEPGAEQVLDAVRRLAGRCVISYDLNLRPAVTGTGAGIRGRVFDLVAHADMVKASDEDLLALFPSLTVERAAADLLRRGPAAVVVTRGVAGAECHLSDGVVRVAARPVQVADTIGAGDTFSAGLVDALWESGHLTPDRLRACGGTEWSLALDHAGRAAAVTVSRPGADPPYRHEVTLHGGA